MARYIPATLRLLRLATVRPPAIAMLAPFIQCLRAYPLLDDPEFNSYLEKRSAKAGGIAVQQGLHQAAALGAMTLLLTAHRGLMNTGFTFSRRKTNTDTLISLSVCLLAFLWTGTVMASGVFIGERPCRKSVEACLARAAYAPWLLTTLSVFWAIAWLDLRRYVQRRAMAADDKQIGIWRLVALRGALDWEQCLSRRFLLALYLSMAALTVATAYGALRSSIYTVGILNLVGVVLFVAGAAGANKYGTAKHNYAGDMLRVVLQTRHSEGTLYILPSKGYGLDAMWSPKIPFENIEADNLVESVSTMRATGECRPNDILQALSACTTTFLRASNLTDEQVSHLAEWLYLDDTPAALSMRKLRARRPPGVHLIGQSLIYALCHAEYLVFVGGDRLPDKYRKQMGMLRASKTTGSSSVASSAVPTIGFSAGGISGYREAVRYVYRLFDEPVDYEALEFPPDLKPPASSLTVPLDGLDTMEAYVARLWDISVQSAEGTLQALLVFTLVWTYDVGNVRGYNGIPLRTRNRQGDEVAWSVVWRQAWFSCVISQLVTMSPVILSAFLSGVLQ